MPFARPTLQTLVERIQADFVSRLELVTPLLRRAIVHVASRVMAGAVHMLHGHLEYLGKQLFPDKSDEEFLLRQAALFGISPTPAEFAESDVFVSGSFASVVPVGTVLTSPSGREYLTTEYIMIEFGLDPCHVMAADAGADDALVDNATLTFVSPPQGIEPEANVAVGTTIQGSDQESTESLRQRLISRMREPPHGGSAADYVAWALEVSGVTRAWCYPLEGGPGTVTVRFVRDDDASPIPDSAEVTAVANHIATVRPATAVVTVAAPTALPVNCTIHIAPDNSTTRAAVQAELTDLLRRVSAPGGIVLLSDIETAVREADGVNDRIVTAPTADISAGAVQLPVLGTITWV